MFLLRSSFAHYWAPCNAFSADTCDARGGESWAHQWSGFACAASASHHAGGQLGSSERKPTEASGVTEVSSRSRSTRRRAIFLRSSSCSRQARVLKLWRIESLSIDVSWSKIQVVDGNLQPDSKSTYGDDVVMLGPRFLGFGEDTS